MAKDQQVATPGLATFTYTAVSPTGERVKAKMQAPDADAVADALAREGWVPLKINEVASGGLNFDVAKVVGRDGLRLKPADLAAFTRQLHQLLRAGVAVPKTLAALGEEADPRLTTICVELSDQVSAGVPLSEAFAAYPKLFDEVFCSYIAAGEASGTLVQSTGRLAKLLEKEAALRSKVKSATAYPKMAGIAIGVVVIGILMFLVPSFKEIYSNFNSELPAPTRGLLWVSGWLSPLHPQIGSVSYAQVPLKGDDLDGPALIPLSEKDQVDLKWSDIDGAWDPSTAPVSIQEVGKAGGTRKVLDEPLKIKGTWLVATTEVRSANGEQTQEVGVIEICADGTVASPPPPNYQGEKWSASKCAQQETLVVSKGLAARYRMAFSEFGISWLNPATWVEPLQQPGRSLWTSPVNWTSPTLYLIIAFFLMRRYLKRHRDDLDVGERVDRIKFGMPIFGELNRNIAMFRWSSTLAGALEAGVQTHKALDLAGRASGSRWIQKVMIEVQEGVQSGRLVSAGLNEHRDLFQPNVRALVSTGEQTGELDALLDSAATTIGEEIDSIISGLAAKIEVVLIVTMGVVVGSIIVVLYLPIFSLATAGADGLSQKTMNEIHPPWKMTS